MNISKINKYILFQIFLSEFITIIFFILPTYIIFPKSSTWGVLLFLIFSIIYFIVAFTVSCIYFGSRIKNYLTISKLTINRLELFKINFIVTVIVLFVSLIIANFTIFILFLFAMIIRFVIYAIMLRKFFIKN
jgi:hypothetical protein